MRSIARTLSRGRLRHCAAALAAVTCLAGCEHVHGEAPSAPRPVKVIEAHPIAQPSAARYAVSIQPNEQIPLAFKAAGYVDEVLQRRGADGRLRSLQAGDLVSGGAVLARVRDDDYRERVNQASAALRELEAAQAKAQRDLDRALILFAAQALTKPDLDSAQTAFDANAARIASSLAQIELARIGLRDTLLVAPRRGIILERKIEIGSLVAGGSIGFLIGDVSTVKALFGVPDSVVHRLTLGRPLAVTTEAFRGETFAGPITAISPSADAQSRVFDVEITIANRSGRLRPGMIGGVDVPSGSAAAPDGRVPAVPLSAIVRSEKHPDEYSVLVVSESDQKTSARSRAVTLGAVEGNLVSVTAGLMAGERVVMMGATLLTDGEIVRVIP